ncbi:protein NODULATION SIGNALING PATHWAY 2 [Ricinus communis]|uniref:Transcription factor, putative n=1 Tax=Ricinus communis TaxID=3988 RepID=B9SKY9_RICCO|nr:protein NODULATION SIGNALING PATHWAY 2 [Ricinus communis]EEF35680.1 transcription factor, putative [Ricinus communis]|eukprot:XP_002526658.1 nodulation-signaling pathway 2 protein [Ricinus communis]
MLESALFQFSCLPYSNNVELSLDDANYTHFDLSPPFTEIDSPSTIEFVDSAPPHDDNMYMEFLFDEPFPFDFQDLEFIWGQDIQENDEGKITTDDYEYCSFSPSIISGDLSTDINWSNLVHQSLIMPKECMGISNLFSLTNLAMAYAEATENKQAALAEVIMRRIGEKVSPISGIKERLLYYAFQPLDKQSDYLKQESFKNFDKAFEVFYQIFPYGMVAHFTANSAILEAKPRDAEILHVVDFDIGEGIQWPSMIMALSQQQNERMQQHGYNQRHLQQITLKITAIKWREEHPWRKLEETKRRLQNYADSLGLMLHVEEIEVQNLAREIKRGGRKEWLAFNCMWAIPHMGRIRSRRHVIEFLTMAKDSVADWSDDRSRGIVTFGEGIGHETLSNCDGFGSFFERYMEHYEGLLESIEWGFPIHLAEARLSMECLFLAPYVSRVSMMQTWKEINEGSDFKTGIGFEGLRVSNNSLMEAKEMVREGDTPYGVRIEGGNSNVLVLDWRGNMPLVTVSAWR